MVLENPGKGKKNSLFIISKNNEKKLFVKLFLIWQQCKTKSEAFIVLVLSVAMLFSIAICGIELLTLFGILLIIVIKFTITHSNIKC